MNARDELAEVIYKARWVDGIKDGQLVTDAALAKTIHAAGYRKPLTIENDKLVIDDGMLLLEVGSCTCTPYGSSHEAFCGYEYLDDLTGPLERAGYVKHRTITTVEELDALPDMSIVATRYGTGATIYRNNPHLSPESFHFLLSDEGDWITVLFEPEAEQ